MGFFSFTCGECDHDMLHGPTPGYTKYTRGTAFFANGDRISGDYDGYGRLGSLNISDIDSGLGGPDGPNGRKSCVYKLVHEACTKKGMTYETIKGMTTHGMEQGFWPGERKAQAQPSPCGASPECVPPPESSPGGCQQCVDFRVHLVVLRRRAGVSRGIS